MPQMQSSIVGPGWRKHVHPNTGSEGRSLSVTRVLVGIVSLPVSGQNTQWARIYLNGLPVSNENLNWFDPNTA